ncbi:MAG: hypothetical protein HY690_13500 [Chloroflexi bacterium]|nr:hypothetical protein [Chloroflexota bacterium]
MGNVSSRLIADFFVRPGALRRAWLRSPAVPLLLANGAAFVLLYPLLQLAHEACALLVAAALSALGELEPVWNLAQWLGIDPIYTAMAVQSLTRVEPLGLVARDWPGELLHAALPGLFLQPDPDDAALVAAAFGGGNPVLALGLSRFAADLVLLACGLVLVHRAPTLRAFGWLVFVDVSLRLVRFPPPIEELEAAGLSFLVFALAPGLTRRDLALSDLAAQYSEPLLALGLGLAALALAQLCLWGPVLAWRAGRRLAAAVSNRAGPLASADLRFESAECKVTLHSQISNLHPFLGWLPAPRGLLLAALGVPLAAGPQLWAWPPSEPEPAPPLARSAPPAAAPMVPVGGDAPRVEAASATSLAGPHDAARPQPVSRSVVRVAGGPPVFAYTVNGRPEMVRGMGYNPMHSGKPADERRALYERDFALMRSAHVNTVAGWDEHEFDQVLLDVAQRHSLGILMPYHLASTTDYTDPEVREYLHARILTWVQRYRDHPAIRMWGLSNEVLHKLIHPSWMQARNDPVKERRAEAFAAFFVSIADDIHALDPDHPVIIRQAEESFVGPIRRALERRPAARPWLVWGVNIYNPRLAKLLTWWRDKGPPHALVVSEFADGGVSQADRPRGYQKLWKMLREHASFTLGGIPYVWYTLGQEEVDSVFGMVGPDVAPVGDSLEAIRQMYLEDEQRE